MNILKTEIQTTSKPTVTGSSPHSPDPRPAPLSTAFLSIQGMENVDETLRFLVAYGDV